MTRQSHDEVSFSFEVNDTKYYVDTTVYFNEWQGETQRIINVYRTNPDSTETLIAHADGCNTRELSEEEARRFLDSVLNPKIKKRKAIKKQPPFSPSEPIVYEDKLVDPQTGEETFRFTVDGTSYCVDTRLFNGCRVVNAFRLNLDKEGPLIENIGHAEFDGASEFSNEDARDFLFSAIDELKNGETNYQ